MDGGPMGWLKKNWLLLVLVGIGLALSVQLNDIRGEIMKLRPGSQTASARAADAPWESDPTVEAPTRP